jgi:hypothetical protein
MTGNIEMTNNTNDTYKEQTDVFLSKFTNTNGRANINVHNKA